jgi:hypothetical protein
MVTRLHAQVPENISVPPLSKSAQKKSKHPEKPDKVCTNFAGTFTLGQFNGHSNSHKLDTIYLCYGDSIAIKHNGDQDLSGDPVPGTPGGIGWATYKGPPTKNGPDYQTILTDPNLETSCASGICIANGPLNGDILFINNGFAQAQYNATQPVQLWYAPITLDRLDFSVLPAESPYYEPAQVGFPPGPCVHVNTSVAFSIVYLNAIKETGINTNFGNDCLGKFRVQGGYPQFDPNAVYDIKIELTTDHSVKAIIHTAKTQLLNRRL